MDGQGALAARVFGGGRRTVALTRAEPAPSCACSPTPTRACPPSAPREAHHEPASAWHAAFFSLFVRTTPWPSSREWNSSFQRSQRVFRYSSAESAACDDGERDEPLCICIEQEERTGDENADDAYSYPKRPNTHHNSDRPPSPVGGQHHRSRGRRLGPSSTFARRVAPSGDERYPEWRTGGRGHGEVQEKVYYYDLFQANVRGRLPHASNVCALALACITVLVNERAYNSPYLVRASSIQYPMLHPAFHVTTIRHPSIVLLLPSHLLVCSTILGPLAARMFVIFPVVVEDKAAGSPSPTKLTTTAPQNHKP